MVEKMAAAAVQSDSEDPPVGPNPLQLMQRLQMLELQAGVDAQNVTLLQKENKELEDALTAVRARGEDHAEALMHIARACEESSNEMKDQHATALRGKDTRIAQLEDAAAAKDVILEQMRVQNAAMATEITVLKVENGMMKAEAVVLKADVTVLQAQTTSKLIDIHTAVAALKTLLLPPPLLMFSDVAIDRDWCSAACGTVWTVDIDVNVGVRVRITNKQGSGWLTLRSHIPLPHCPSPALAADGRQRHRLPAYRVVIEALSFSLDHWYDFGFVPSHDVGTGAAVTPTCGRDISGYGGWWIRVFGSMSDPVSEFQGWTAWEPSPSAAGDNALPGTSAYATTSVAPRVCAGSAVEFAVDYAAGTCRVAFYSPAAVKGGFADAPHATMELRFVAVAAMSGIPARPVPTLADSGVELYPAVCTREAGFRWRFERVDF